MFIKPPRFWELRGNSGKFADLSAMRFRELLNRELEVAFSKDAQPVWFRILKYILLSAIIYFFWGRKLLWVILAIVFIAGLLLHFWYRYKTKGWTRSYGMWKHDKK